MKSIGAPFSYTSTSTSHPPDLPNPPNLPDPQIQLQWLLQCLLDQAKTIEMLTARSEQLLVSAGRCNELVNMLREDNEGGSSLAEGPILAALSPSRHQGVRGTSRLDSTEALEKDEMEVDDSMVQNLVSWLAADEYGSRRDSSTHVRESTGDVQVTVTTALTHTLLGNPEASPLHDILNAEAGPSRTPSLGLLHTPPALNDYNDAQSLSSGIESPPPSTVRDLSVQAVSPPPSLSLYKGKGKRVSESPLTESQERRRVRGRSALLPQKILEASTGQRTGLVGLKWPTLGPNTERGRLQEVNCDQCKGRVHWACAGLCDADLIGKEPWCCPDCLQDMGYDRSSLVPIKKAQQERCIRPDCIMRGFKPKKRKPSDGDNFFFERIIGRRAFKRTSSGRAFEFLVKWSDYEVYDCTWQTAKDISDCDRHHKIFIRECERLGITTQLRVALLPEAESCWNDKGLRKRAMLLNQGVEEAEWWEGENDEED